MTEPVNSDNEPDIYNESTRRKSIIGLGAVLTASVAAGVVTCLMDNEDIYEDENGDICYSTSFEDIGRNESVTFHFNLEDRDNEFRLVGQTLEKTEDGYEACVDPDQLNDEESYSLSRITTEDETIWEGDYSIS